MSANAIVGEVVRRQHTVINLLGAHPTGLLISDFTIALYLDGVAATETVTLSDLGSGNYEFLFTPLSPGIYTFFGTEGAFANSQGLSFNDAWITVLTEAVFTPSPANAFCAVTDVERYMTQNFSSTSSPTDMDVLGWMEELARRLTAKCEVAGHRVTPAGGNAPLSGLPPDTELEAMLRAANALGVAVMACNGGYLGVPPADSDRGSTFYAEYLKLMGGLVPGSATEILGEIVEYIQATFAPGAYAATHISTGQVTRYSPPAGLASTLRVNELTEW